MTMVRLLLLILFISRTISQENNVCKNLLDYLTLPINENCWHNPNIGLAPNRLINSYGYPFESYKVVTDDGYILTLFRIPHNNINISKRRQPLLLQHGIFASSKTFLTHGIRSLPFFLADNGFDVWLGNLRGTEFSAKHVYLTSKDPTFWNFSFHEIGIYDLPAQIDFIAKKTGYPGKIIYMGYSMGTTASFVYSILKAEHAKKNLVGIVSVCPVAYLANIKGLSIISAYFMNVIRAIITVLNIHVLFKESSKFTKLVHILNEKSPFIYISLLILLWTTGPSQQILPALLPVLFSSAPTSTTVKMIIHYLQEIRNRGAFRFYDYGMKENLKLYNSTTPPNYDVSKINIPVHMLYGRSDYIATGPDSITFYNQLNVTNKSITQLAPTGNVKFNHLDILYARDVEIFFYEPLMKIINDKLRM